MNWNIGILEYFGLLDIVFHYSIIPVFHSYTAIQFTKFSGKIKKKYHI
jgi:hypothetical protein